MASSAKVLHAKLQKVDEVAVQEAMKQAFSTQVIRSPGGLAGLEQMSTPSSPPLLHPCPSSDVVSASSSEVDDTVLAAALAELAGGDDIDFHEAIQKCSSLVASALKILRRVQDENQKLKSDRAAALEQAQKWRAKALQLAKSKREVVSAAEACTSTWENWIRANWIRTGQPSPPDHPPPAELLMKARSHDGSPPPVRRRDCFHEHGRYQQKVLHGVYP